MVILFCWYFFQYFISYGLWKARKSAASRVCYAQHVLWREKGSVKGSKAHGHSCDCYQQRSSKDLYCSLLCYICVLELSAELKAELDLSGCSAENQSRGGGLLCKLVTWQDHARQIEELRNLLLIVTWIDQLVVALCFAFGSSMLMKRVMVQESSSVVAKMVVWTDGMTWHLPCC